MGPYAEPHGAAERTTMEDENGESGLGLVAPTAL